MDVCWSPCTWRPKGKIGLVGWRGGWWEEKRGKVEDGRANAQASLGRVVVPGSSTGS